MDDGAVSVSTAFSRSKHVISRGQRFSTSPARRFLTTVIAEHASRIPPVSSVLVARLRAVPTGFNRHQKDQDVQRPEIAVMRVGYVWRTSREDKSAGKFS